MRILVYYLASKQNWIICLFCCSECSIGFYGLYPICNECPFPSFGFECQYICDCNNDTCDHVTGCMDSMLFIGIICFLCMAKFHFFKVEWLNIYTMMIKMYLYNICIHSLKFKKDWHTSFILPWLYI